MIKRFKYLSPKTLDEAVSFYKSYEKKAVYIAGGTDVIVKIKEEKLAPDYLISLKNISGLDKLFVDEESGELHIGALVTHRILETSQKIQRDYPIIYDAVSNIGSVQIRNMATIAGNLVNAVPSADGAIPLIALDAKAVYYGLNGWQSVSLEKFFLSPGQSILKDGEILTEIVVPPAMSNTGGAYIKFGRREAMELPIISVGVLLGLDSDLKTCIRAGICLGVVGPTPIKAVKAEKFLLGKTVNEDILKEVGKVASKETQVRDSIRGAAWYRRDMVKVLVKRMGLKALEIIQQKAK